MNDLAEPSSTAHRVRGYSNALFFGRRGEIGAQPLGRFLGRLSTVPLAILFHSWVFVLVVVIVVDTIRFFSSMLAIVSFFRFVLRIFSIANGAFATISSANCTSLVSSSFSESLTSVFVITLVRIEMSFWFATCTT